MRYFVRAAIPTMGGNKVILQGKLGETIDEIMKELKPEVAFFRATETGPAAGMKSMSMIVNLDDASQIRTTVEPLFRPLEAKLEYEAVMSPDDLMKALPSIEQAVKKYGDDGRAAG